jgi:predicted nuclease of predicted toxin-antitoxin system
VKFLVDANLPPALARWLTSEGHEAHHVSDLGMERAPDRPIKDSAEVTDDIIVDYDAEGRIVAVEILDASK